MFDERNFPFLPGPSQPSPGPSQPAPGPSQPSATSPIQPTVATSHALPLAVLPNICSIYSRPASPSGPAHPTGSIHLLEQTRGEQLSSTPYTARVGLQPCNTIAPIEQQPHVTQQLMWSVFSNSPVPCSLTSPNSDSSTSTPPLKIKSVNELVYKHPLPSALVAASSSSPDFEPRHFKQAVDLPQWQQAMSEEMNALTKNGTWSLVPRTPRMNVVGSRWIFKIKHWANGDIERHKARLVAQGYTQHEGVDFDETLSPVVKPPTIRSILAIAHSRSWNIQQLDVRNAFLNEILQEEVYMSQPPGFTDQRHPSHVDNICSTFDIICFTFEIL